ncbi:unnamed protein product [Fraxinus pennsylvanica]|uniref:Mono-/di-acylglycerol lipase N-terminal domain-containing protein n=1 Tax=Fraxinus pennsylvanica TaxID=56036 RepID=A0AAD2AI82_9LAMI|nr:unnamed protein product [Fraxinus pennsylvanica]
MPFRSPSFRVLSCRNCSLGKGSEIDEDDPFQDEDLPDDYKKMKFSALSILQLLSLILIITALVCSHDTETWGLATPEEFEPVPRLCRYILAVFEDDLRHPLWEPPEGYGINADWIIIKGSYKDTNGRAPLIYCLGKSGISATKLALARGASVLAIDENEKLVPIGFTTTPLPITQTVSSFRIPEGTG